MTGERELFEACCGLAEPERSAWLAANCQDGALRERLQRLLRAHDAAEAGRGFPAGVRPRRQEPWLIGPYRVLERIGEGGIGDVYLAEQTTPVVRRVALKVIKLGMDTREVIARFEAERQTLAIMSHPSIAQIFDAGATAEGRPYFAMEYVPGVPLTTYCETQRIGLQARLSLFLAVCDGVQHAHQKGIIHRDLKPSNLLVAERDGQPAAKIIDFGVAKATTPSLQTGDAHTRIGTLVGTPQYMSPEQAELSPLDVDTRSDVYSLGVVLYELLVGTLPYRLTATSATPAQLMNELLATVVRAPSEALRRDAGRAAQAAAQCASTPREHLHAVRGELDWIVLKALEKDRNRRYASVAEFAADVRRYLADEPVLAGPPSAAYRLSKFVARHQAWAAAAAGLFLATAAFGAIMALQARELARERDTARFQAARAEASNEFMSAMLEQIGPGDRPVTMTELLDGGLELLDRQYGADPAFAGRMLLQMSRRYMDLQDTARFREVLGRAESIARTQGDDELLARVHCATVHALFEENRFEDARRRIEAARESAARVAHPTLEMQVDCLRAEAEVLRRVPDHQAALEVLGRARTLLEDAGATHGLAYTATLTDTGAVHFQAGQIREALAVTEQVRDALERNGRGSTLAMAITLGNLGQVHYRLGEVRTAEEIGRQALARMSAIRGEVTRSPSQNVAYAITLIRLDRAAEAEQLLQAAQAQMRADNNQLWAAVAGFQRGRALLALGRLAESDAEFSAAEAAWRSNPTAHAGRLAELERSRAELELALGRTADARSRIDRLLSDSGFPGRSDAPVLPAALRTAARIELAAGAPAAAESYAAAALKLARAVAGNAADSADTGEALLLVGLAQRAAGSNAAAGSLADAAVTLAGSLGPSHPLTLEAQAAG